VAVVVVQVNELLAVVVPGDTALVQIQLLQRGQFTQLLLVVEGLVAQYLQILGKTVLQVATLQYPDLCRLQQSLPPEAAEAEVPVGHLTQETQVVAEVVIQELQGQIQVAQEIRLLQVQAKEIMVATEVMMALPMGKQEVAEVVQVLWGVMV
jgi:hypothetical protein